MTDSETTAPAPSQLWRADLETRSSIEFHFPEGDSLIQVEWQFHLNGDFQGKEIITPEEARDRLRAMAAEDANPPEVRAKATEYADEFDRRLALTPTVLDEFPLRSNPEHKVTVTLKGAAYWWQCSADCYDGDSAPTPSLARLAAFHHSMLCGRTWADVDENYREILAQATGSRYLVRLPVYGASDDVVEIHHPSALRDLTWTCSACGTEQSDHRMFYIHAAAAVHAAECRRNRDRDAPQAYLDEVERAAAPRIEQRQADAVAPIQADLDQREAALAELQTEHEALAGDRDAQAAKATRLDGELADERTRTRGWRLAAVAAAAVALGALALLAVVTL